MCDHRQVPQFSKCHILPGLEIGPLVFHSGERPRSGVKNEVARACQVLGNCCQNFLLGTQ